MGWDRAGIPSQFAVIPRGENAIVGYCGFYHHAEVPGEIEIGYRLHPDYLESRPDHRNRARGSQSRFSRSETVARHLADSPREHPITSRGGEEWNGGRKANYFSRFPDAGVCDGF